jgi:hypothetical protein
MAPLPNLGGVEPFAGLGPRFPLVAPGRTVNTTFTTGTQNDFAVTQGTSILTFSANATGVRRITGFSVPGAQLGQLLVVQNQSGITSGPAYIELSLFDSNSQAANQICGPQVQSVTVPTIIYLPTLSSIMLIFGAGGWFLLGTEFHPPTRQQKIERQAQAIEFGRQNRSWFTDYEGLYQLLGTVGGAGAITRHASGQGGVVTLSSGAAGGGFADLSQGDATAASIFVSNARTRIWTAYARVQFQNSVTANSRFQVAGIIDATRAHYTGLSLTGTGAGTATLNMAFDGVFAATSWAFDSTAFHEFFFFWGGSAIFNLAMAFVDGALVGFDNTHQPQALASRFFTQAFNNGVATNEQFDLDEAGVFTET